MKLKELVAVLNGNENLELHIDGCRNYLTTKNMPEKYMEREVESVRLDSKIYLGIVIRCKDLQTAA